MPVGSNPPSHTAPYPHLEPYDIEDRTLYGKAEATPDGYGGMEQGRLRYEPSGRKLFWNKDGESGYPNPTERCELYFYSITGQRLARYKCAYNQDEYDGPYRFGVWLVDRNQHIGGQLTSDGGKAVTTDRLGSTRAKDAERYTYFPYGEPRTATVSGGGVYAGLENPLRVYDAGSGRFNRPDPLGLGAVKMGDPGSWNRFAYVQGDPVNYVDPLGLCQALPGTTTCISTTVVSISTTVTAPPNPATGGPGILGGSNLAMVDPDTSILSPQPPPTGFPECPPIPFHPNEANVNANVMAARDYVNALKQGFEDSPTVGRSIQTFQKLLWLYDHVKNSGPYDYKQDKTGNYENFGNFNFGAVGAALGIDLSTLLKGAGFAQQRAGTSRPAFGVWHGPPPYGDDPRDQEMIKRGYEYYEALAKGCK
jgi:RHS repeat-associated protein